MASLGRTNGQNAQVPQVSRVRLVRDMGAKEEASSEIQAEEGEGMMEHTFFEIMKWVGYATTLFLSVAIMWGCYLLIVECLAATPGKLARMFKQYYWINAFVLWRLKRGREAYRTLQDAIEHEYVQLKPVKPEDSDQ